MTERCNYSWSHPHVCCLPKNHESPHICYYIEQLLLQHPNNRAEILSYIPECVKDLTMDDIPPQTFRKELTP